MHACGVTVGRAPSHDVVGSGQGSPCAASSLGLACNIFIGIEDAPYECSDSDTTDSSSDVGSLGGKISV